MARRILARLQQNEEEKVARAEPSFRLVRPHIVQLQTMDDAVLLALAAPAALKKLLISDKVDKETKPHEPSGR